MIYVLLEYSDIGERANFEKIITDVHTAFNPDEYKFQVKTFTHIKTSLKGEIERYFFLVSKIENAYDKSPIEHALAETLVYHRLAYKLFNVLIQYPEELSYKDQGLLTLMKL